MQCTVVCYVYLNNGSKALLFKPRLSRGHCFSLFVADEIRMRVCPNIFFPVVVVSIRFCCNNDGYERKQRPWLEKAWTVRFFETLEGVERRRDKRHSWPA